MSLGRNLVGECDPQKNISKSGDALPALLEELLASRKRRKEIRKKVKGERNGVKKLREKQAKKRTKRVQELQGKYPSLQKTLLEIAKFDVALPSELFPKTESTEGIDQDSSHSFSWTTSKTRGLEEFLFGGKAHVESKSELKRKRDDLGEDKTPKKWVAVSPYKSKTGHSQILKKFFNQAQESVGSVAGKLQVKVKWIARKTSSPTNQGIPKNEFFVDIGLEHKNLGNLGFLVGLDPVSHALYIKGFHKHNEQFTKDRLFSIDPSDPAIGPGNFSKKGKLCFQWMQRMVHNEKCTFFTASDLYKVSPKITMNTMFHTFAQI